MDLSSFKLHASKEIFKHFKVIYIYWIKVYNKQNLFLEKSLFYLSLCCVSLKQKKECIFIFSHECTSVFRYVHMRVQVL